jgi:hypothetical protein
MAAWLNTQGHAVNRKRVQRLMRLMGLVAIYQRPNTSKAAAEHIKYPYLLGGLTIDRVNQVWCSDITYIPMPRGFLYLVVIMDWHSDPEAPAALRPAIAEVGILMDMGFVQVDQPMAVVLGTDQQVPNLREERFPPLRVSSAEQLAGLLPRQLQAVQGAADRLAAAAATKRLLHPADQTPQGPAWRRVSPG